MKRIIPRIAAALRWQTFAAGMAGLLIGGGIGLGLIIAGSRDSSVIVRNIYELDGVAVRGGQLDIVLDIDRLRQCPAETSRWLWTWVDQAGHKVRQFFPLPTTPTTLTDVGIGQHLILSLPLPAGIWPGEWFYLSRTVEQCPILPGLFRPNIHESPNVPVRIVGAMP